MIVDATCEDCEGKGYVLELSKGCDFDCNSHFDRINCETCNGEGIVEVYESQE